MAKTTILMTITKLNQFPQMTRLMRVKMIQTTFLKTYLLLLTKKRAKWLQSLAWLASETRWCSKTTHRCRSCKNQASNRGMAERQLITKQTRKAWVSGEVQKSIKRVIPHSIKTLPQLVFTESKRLCHLASSLKTEQYKGPIVASTTMKQKVSSLHQLTPSYLSLRSQKCKKISLTFIESLPISSHSLKTKMIRRTITRTMKNFDQFLYKLNVKNMID